MRYFITTIIVLVVSAAIVLGAHFYIAHKINSKSTIRLQLQHDLHEFGSAANLEYLFADDKIVAIKEEALARLAENFRYEEDILESLSLAIPREAWLTDMVQKEQKIKMSGYVTTNKELGIFMENLSNKSIFRAIKLSSSKPQTINGMKVYQFTISGILQERQ